MSGKLWIVPTPIGNLEDITLRALRVLKEADIVYAEDTRTSGNLLRHYNIETPLRPYHLHNEHTVGTKIASAIELGETAALVSDAGTPGISDPGFLLVRECLARGVEVECLPGPTAFVPAVVMSGFPSDRFVYEGFLPQKKGRQKRLAQLATETRTIVLYESPHRIVRLLEELAHYLGAQREVAILREMTKLYATVYRGEVSELLSQLRVAQPKGEFVVVISQQQHGTEKEITAQGEC